MSSSKQRPILIVGAGFAGAVVARELAERGKIPSVVIDSRDHVAGNCHSVRAADTGILEHVYGPHIFHTSNRDTWDYVNRFGVFHPCVNRVKASTQHGIFSLPINLHTINQFYGKRLNPGQAEAFLASVADSSITAPANFEEQALKMIGRDLYEAFFLGYTQKQWGCSPRELPASILSRLPVRFSYDDSYYSDTFVGIPEAGYTRVIENMLDHPCISIRLSAPWDPAMQRDFDHVFFSGPIDAFFGYEEGRLGYRTVYWDRLVAEGDYQGNAVINYPGLEVPFTRVHEHKHFAPWETHNRTVVFTEFSKETTAVDTPYYPKRLRTDMTMLEKYQQRAAACPGVNFIGRLGCYRYLDMNVVIEEARRVARKFLEVC
jgi:UDP-galactopyranose mutase